MGFVSIILLTFSAGMSLLLFWEDYRSRHVSVLYLLLLGLAGIVMKLYRPFHLYFIEDMIVNAAIIAISMAILWLYFTFIREKKFWDNVFGKGDLAMIVVSACWLETQYFLMFLITGCLWGVLFGFIMRKQGNIPFAGILSLYLVIYWPLIRIY